MAKREFLMLAHEYEEERYGIASWFASEKLDGMRAWWDGGVTRGRLAKDVPFANVAKDDRLLRDRVSTGLWSRYGKVVSAPDWWLDKLPLNVPLDGELWMGRGSFQSLISTVKHFTASDDWRRVQFVAFDSPSWGTVLSDGVISNTNFKKRLSGTCRELGVLTLESRPFEQSFKRLLDLGSNDAWRPIQQEQLPATTDRARARLRDLLDEVAAAGGEGLMLRHPSSLWTPERVRTLLKVKKLRDAEGTVVGYTWGRRTELGSKLLGLMGALVLETGDSKQFELSGFTEDERRMKVTELSLKDLGDYEMHPEFEKWYHMARVIGEMSPGERCDNRVCNPRFPMGSKVTYTYRELTDGGFPKEARYLRRGLQ